MLKYINRTIITKEGKENTFEQFEQERRQPPTVSVQIAITSDFSVG